MTRLGKVLKARGITQAELARSTGIHPAVLSRTISGERAPSPVTLRMLMEVLDLDVEALGFANKVEPAPEVEALAVTAQARIAELEAEIVESGKLLREILSALESADNAMKSIRGILGRRRAQGSA